MQTANRGASTNVTIGTIGTPLSSHATRVMLLGAGELGKEVIIALQRLGVETIAVDRYAERARSSGRASFARDRHDRRRRVARAGRKERRT